MAFWIVSVIAVAHVKSLESARVHFMNETNKPEDKHVPTIKQRTSGKNSPAIGSIGNITGSNVTIGTATKRESSYRPTPPQLTPRRVLGMPCNFPIPDQQELELSELPCMVLAIRNNADSSEGTADNVIAHLDFESDQHPPISIDEAWWHEDEDGYAKLTLSIFRSETKHLVLTLKSQDGQCYAVPKYWDANYYRHLPKEPVLIPTGRWRLTIEVTAERYRLDCYLTGEVLEGGDSKWSNVMPTRPSDWPRA
jgi:hypothetical protein